MNAVERILRSVDHLFFPQVCAGCGSDLVNAKEQLCLACEHALPLTHFELHANNPVEKIFWGRIPVTAAASFLYFTKGSLLQYLLHQLKYRGNKEVGYDLGKRMGKAFFQSNRFRDIDALVALPLYASRERKRGYNQAALICDGFSAATKIPFLNYAVKRISATETQTHKNRIERWLNMEGRFEVPDTTALENKRILLVDDVITTGATLEACGQELLKVPGLQLNIASLAYTLS
jgi:ComF family protein